MHCLAADIGNSRTKIAWDDSDPKRDAVEYFDFESGIDSLKTMKGRAHWTLCSVQRERCKSLVAWIKTHRPDDRVHQLQPADVPMACNVESEQQLGRDRQVGAWQALTLQENKGPLVVVDAGTAVTVDWIDSSGVFQGGVIFPGCQTALRSLGQATDRLPDLAHPTDANAADKWSGEGLGKNTTQAITEGVFGSQWAAIQHFVESFAARSRPQPTAVIVTGGEIHLWKERLPTEWQWIPHLVLQGAFELGRRRISAES